MMEINEKSPRDGFEIAVIGMEGRFPGAKNIDEFWINLKNSVESICFFSAGELKQAGVEAALVDNPSYVKAKGILEDGECFDFPFFDYTAREAENMDPQLRILHECSWAALEHAGYNPGSYEGTIGVYIGSTFNVHWVSRFLNENISRPSELFDAANLNDRDSFATAISYKLNLRGPAVVVQTTCSTSLAAIHFACQALLVGECDMALAGGVCVTTPQKAGYWYQEGMIFSADGHCRAFDAKAGGTVLGNGAGIVVLKPLEEALEQGDFIYARVKASAMNNDGKRKVGFTAPSVKGQAEVVVTAHCAAGLPAESIGYIEAHGTGTTLGDPVEIEALKQAFDTDKRGFCAIGSVKSNIGHLDAAAGAAGFIKTVLALKNKKIPPTLYFKNPNPKIDFQDSPFYVNTTLKEWRNHKYPLRAGVSSFGIGGTNVHVVLEEWPEDRRQSRGRGEVPSPSREYRLILLSARTGAALERAAANLLKHLKTNPGINLADAAYTLQVGREHFEHRQMFVCSTMGEAEEALSFSPATKIRTSVLNRRQQPEVVFMFPGQGTQYVDMGLGLYKSEPVFRQEMDRCFEILNGLLDYDIKEILYPFYRSDRSNRSYKSYKSHINQTEIAQPLLFIFEYSLAKMMIKWGIKPGSMMGHSLGEYTAACLSGVFSLEDALKLVVVRGRLMQQVPGGTMLGVQLTPDRLKPILEAHKELSLAAVNAPTYCVVSGPDEAAAKLEKQLDEKGCIGRRLQTSHAFHSRMMEPVSGEFEQVLKQENITFHSPSIPFISSSTGTWITAKEAKSPGYWASQLRKTIRFSRGVEELVKGKGEEESMVFLEVGPGRTLSALLRKQEDKKPRYQAVNLVRHPLEDIPDDFYLLERIGQLWLKGIQPYWEGFYLQESRRRIPLPGYSFESHACPVDSNVQSVSNSLPSLPLTKQPNIRDWFYIQSWKQLNDRFFQTLEVLEKHCWLVFMNECHWQETFIKTLRRYGQDVITVRAGPTLIKKSHREYIINPGEKADYNSLFADLFNLDKIPYKIVHFWTVNGESPGIFLEDRLKESLELGYYSLLNIAQSIGEEMAGDDIQINVITDSLHCVTGREKLRPMAATVLGPVKIIPLEYPNISCRNIDVVIPDPPGREPFEPVMCLLEEISSGVSDELVAYRDHKRWVRFFKPYPREEPSSEISRLKINGIYLITGGLGGIGFALAKYLAGRYKARLILVGRSFFPPRQDWKKWLADQNQGDPLSLRILAIEEMEANGAEFMVITADISDRARMQKVLEQVKKQFGTIDGVIHCAGLAEGALIPARTKEMSKKTLDPKVMGTLVLDSVLEGMKLDFFVLCSSLGNILYREKFGQVAYNAGNEFLDAFAHYKNAVGNTYTVSINWDDWQEVGMSIKSAKNWDRLLDNHGFKSRETNYPLFNKCTLDNPGRVIYVSRLSADKHWVLREHCYNRKGVLPGTAYLEIVRAAFEDHTQIGTMEIRDIHFKSPLVIESGEEKEVHTVLRKKAGFHCFTFGIRSRDHRSKDTWQEHAAGEIRALEYSPVETCDIEDIAGRCRLTDNVGDRNKPIPLGGLIDFGPRWKYIVKRIKSGENQWLMELELPGEFRNDLEWYKFHPALADAAAAFPRDIVGSEDQHSHIPIFYKRVCIKKSLPAKIYSFAALVEENRSSRGIAKLNIRIMNPQGEVLVEIDEYTLAKADVDMLNYKESRENTPAHAGISGSKNFYLDIPSPGKLDSLVFCPADRKKPAAGEVEIEVFAVGLNFKDVLLALGILPPPEDREIKLGQECSGKITAVGEGVVDFNMGDEVIASGHSCFSSFVTVPAFSVARKPANLDFLEAATIPVAFMTAYYALIKIGRLKKGERVLIHAAAGGVGMAAVFIAQWIGTDIFATAGNQHKREYLRALGIKYVMNSRTLDFAGEIMEYTAGKGVDVVLNSLAGEFIQKSLSILSIGGRFLEIGLKDILDNTQLGLKPFEKGLSFAAVQGIDGLPDYNRTWHELIRLFSEGNLKPLPYKVFSITNAVQAFEYMAKTKHIGKIILSLEEKNKIPGNLSHKKNLEPGPANGFQQKLRTEGILPVEGVTVFNRVLAGTAPQTAVSTLDLISLLEERTHSKNLMTGREFSSGKPGGSIVRKAGYIAPVNEIQKTISTIWQEFFRREPIGIEDNFFDMGATSLDIIQVNNRLNETLEMDIPVAAWFRYPTIHSLTSYLNLDKINGAITGEEEEKEEKRAAKIHKGIRNSLAKRKLRKGETIHD